MLMCRVKNDCCHLCWTPESGFENCSLKYFHAIVLILISSFTCPIAFVSTNYVGNKCCCNMCIIVHCHIQWYIFLLITKSGVAVGNVFIKNDIGQFLKNGSVKSKNEIMIIISIVYRLHSFCHRISHFDSKISIPWLRGVDACHVRIRIIEPTTC